MGLFSRKGGGPDDVRPIHDDAVAALDHALGQLGQVTHAVDPARAVAFAAGGPPVWSVGFVAAPGYTLVVTYGLSYTVSPESERAGIPYELSIAVPHGEPVAPWADAFLRGQAHYILTQKAQLELGACVPFRGVPITRMAFAPEYAAMMPDTALVGILVARDPVIPVVATPRGDIEVRRLVGIDQYEIDRAVTWDPAALLELVRGQDPLLLSPLARASYLPALQATIEPRAQREGSVVEGVLLELGWQQLANAVRIMLPQGPSARRVVDAMRGRIGFGRKLVAFSTVAPPITFVPGAPGMDVTAQGLELSGELASPPISMIVDALTSGAPSVDLASQPPPAARVRARFFERVAYVVKAHDLDQQKMSKELTKMLDEARAVAAMAPQVSAVERDADRAAASAAIRALRFARVTDQSAVEAMIALLT
ncbi:MAG: suppressor of fused domain protein [Kofleriaceae bacterium]